MGLDMYLSRYHKANLEKTTFNAKESLELQDWGSKYDIWHTCPKPFKDIATEIILTNQYYDLGKISHDYANGERLHISGFSGEHTLFSNSDGNIAFSLEHDVIEKDYLISKVETEYLVEGEHEVAYWRKANQIRQWFVNHIDEFNINDNSEYYTVTKGLLEKLIQDCNNVLNNHSMAEGILPTSSGFFFGSTEYDDWYYDQLESTIEQCRAVIDDTDWDNEVVVYTESW